MGIVFDQSLNTSDSPTFGGLDVNSITIGDGVDAILTADAADTLALRNSTTAQQFNVYNTYTDASNYERLEVKWDTDEAFIVPAFDGTGSARNLVVGSDDGAVRFDGTNNIIRWYIGGSGATNKMFLNTNGLTLYGDYLPQGDSTRNLGASGTRYANTFTDSITIGDGVDAILTADAANILAMRNGATANEFRVYNTYTDAANNEYFAIDWNVQTNVCTLRSLGNGTGTSRDLDIYNGASRSIRTSTQQVKIYRNMRFNATTLDLGETTTNSCPRNIFCNNKFATAGYFEQTSETTADPTTTEYPADTNWGIHRNTTSGNVFLAYNDNGSIVKVQLT